MAGRRITVELRDGTGGQECKLHGQMGSASTESRSGITTRPIRVSVLCLGTERDGNLYSGVLTSIKLQGIGAGRRRDVIQVGDGFNIIAVTRDE